MIAACVLSLLFVPCNAMTAAGREPTKTGDAFYHHEMQFLQTAIHTHFFDQDSGYYLIVVDPAKRETKDGHLREYTYIWALCALYQAANEIEKLDPDANLMEPMLEMMQDYYDPAPPAPGYSDYIMKLKPGERYYDDNQWIGITSLDAFERKQRQSDFAQGKLMYDFMMTGYDDVLGGGIYWKDTDKSTKNTCSNGPGVLVALQMYQATKDQQYLDAALRIYNWTNKNLQTPSKLFYDNIRTKDRGIGRAIFSYNAGTMLQSNLYLYEITGEQKYLDEANAIADSSLAYFYGGERFRDGYWFNAVMLRAYQHLLKHNKDMIYIQGFKKCLDHSLQHDKNEAGLFKGRDGVRDLVEHGGMLEILARFAWLERQSDPDLSASISGDEPDMSLSRFDFFYAGEAKQQNMYIVKDGRIAWEYRGPKDQGEISDAVLMTNGNILFAHQYGVTLISPNKEVLWSHEAPKGCEIHTAQPIGDQHVVFIQCGNPARVIVVNIESGKTAKSFVIPTKNPDSVHGQLRHARLTRHGTYLVAHMDRGKVCEYDIDGKELFALDAPGVWSAEPLENDNILVSSNHGYVREFDREGNVVWDAELKDLAKFNITNPQIALRRPNGNTLVNNWFNEWSGSVDKDNPPYQAIELTPEGNVVWALRSWHAPADLGPSTTIQIFGDRGISENVTFGPFQ